MTYSIDDLLLRYWLNGVGISQTSKLLRKHFALDLPKDTIQRAFAKHSESVERLEGTSHVI